MLTRNKVEWLQKLAGGPINIAPPLDGGTGQSTGDTTPEADTLPQPMQPDCKVVRGQVPGPDNFVLCAMHGHILDLDKKLIVAHSLKDFEAQHPEYGKLPMPMLPDCVIVRNKVPGPKHHVLCKTHGHVMDEEKKQIIAYTLDDYKRQHPAAGPGTSGPGGKSPAGAKPAKDESVFDKDPNEVLMDIVGTVDEPAMALAAALKALPNFRWNVARDGCGTEIKALEMALQPLETGIGNLQKYVVGLNKASGDLKDRAEALEFAVACRLIEQEIDKLSGLLDKDELGNCLRQRAGTYQIDTGTNDATVAQAMKQYDQQKQAVQKALAALRPPMHRGHEWGKWTGQLKS